MSNDTLYFANMPKPNVVGMHNTDYGQTIYDIAYQHSPSKKPEAVQRYMKALIRVNGNNLRKLGINPAKPNVHKLLPFMSFVLPNLNGMNEAALADAKQHAAFVNRLPRDDREKLHQMINSNIDINTFNSTAILAMSLYCKRPTKQMEQESESSIAGRMGKLAMILGEQFNEAVEKESEKVISSIESTEEALQEYINASDLTEKAAARKQFVANYQNLNKVYNDAVNELNHLQVSGKKIGYLQNAKTLAQAKKGTKFIMMDLKAFYHSSLVLKYSRISGGAFNVIELGLVGYDTYEDYEHHKDWVKTLVDGLGEFGGGIAGGAAAGFIFITFLDAPFFLAIAGLAIGAALVGYWGKHVADYSLNMARKYANSN